jgi:hypothetical protein
MTRVISTPGTHAITAADNGTIIAVRCGATLALDEPAALGEGWSCRIKTLTYGASVVEVVRAAGGTIDGAARVLLPFTHDNLHLAVVDGELCALDQTYRRQAIVSHRTVTVENIGASKVWSAGVKDIGAVVRCSCAAAGGLPASSMMITLPPMAEIGGPPYRRGGLHLQRIDGGAETVTIFAHQNEAPINGSSAGFLLQGAFTWREFYCDGQMWFAR